jgi:hypothetical protein
MTSPSNPSAARGKLAETREALWAEVARVRSKVPGVNFPRSQAMKLLLGGNSRKALWVAGLGLLALKPRLARTVLSLAPGLLRAFLR